jgi:hypothetical protein
MAATTDLDRRLLAAHDENRDIWAQTDETGAILVSVGAGGAVETVRLADGWWRRVRPEDAGATVLTLMRASVAARGETATALAAETGDAPSAAADASVPSPTFPEGATSDRAQLTDRLNAVFTAFTQLDDYRRSVNEAARASTQLRSPSGRVALEVVGGGVRSLTIDAESAPFAPEEQLEGEIVDLLTRADSWLADQQEQALDRQPELRAVVQAVRAREGRAS